MYPIVMNVSIILILIYFGNPFALKISFQFK